jgi:hypothetical protein
MVSQITDRLHVQDGAPAKRQPSGGTSGAVETHSRQEGV